MDSVKGRDILGCYTINVFAQALQVWVYTALPELGATFDNPLPNNPSPPILAYKGRKGRRQFKEVILSQTRVINFVQKDIGEMFPKWEFDVEDTPAENTVKLMFMKKPWKWTMDYWEVTGTEAGGCDSSEEKADAMKEGFGTCLKEIKYLSERMEVVEKKVAVPADVPADASSSEDKAPEPSLVLLDKNQSTVSDLQKEDARYLEKRDAALALCRAKNYRTRKLVASHQSPYTANSTAKVIISNRKLYPGYNPFAPIDKKKLKELADWLKTCPHYRTALDKKPRKSRTWWYQILRTSLEWLEDCHIDAWINALRKRYDANPQHFRSERMCFLDHLFAQQWRFNFKDFKDSKPDHNGLGRRLPGGAWNYYAGTIPSFCQSNKIFDLSWTTYQRLTRKSSSKTTYLKVVKADDVQESRPR
uniref:Uncharacterized protein n=1 Tax=Brassica oleracea var. oleracea TaxID=109376 RepID=A0A0D3B8P1_BRAOL